MAGEGCIPATALTDRSKHYAKAIELKKLLVNKYKKEPQFYARAPGRVNIIGEHIDYCGYSVLPMALEQDIMMAVSVTTEEKLTLSLTNADSCHADFTCDINSFSIEVRKGEAPSWHNYVLCGVKGILELLPGSQSSVGLIIAVSGNIPLSSGLSSSSALVVASAMATAYANKYSIDKLKMANVCAAAERYIGTQGGGMDQAISMLGTKGSAKHIMFNPLREEDMKLPDGAIFVIAHSLAVLNKAKTSDYNQRVAECRIAAQIIAKKHGLNWESFLTLADLQKQLNVCLVDMIRLVNKILHKDIYTKEEICKELEVDEQKLNSVSLANNTTHLKEFKLHQRALHVYMEASRVKAFCDICKTDMDTPSKLKELGLLMQQSHESLRDLFECSHPNLDRIVELGKNVTLGVRLTGAGWGGCTVALSTKESCSYYIKVLKEQFYKGHPGAVDRDIDCLVFSTEPSEGAEIFTAA